MMKMLKIKLLYGIFKIKLLYQTYEMCSEKYNLMMR